MPFNFGAGNNNGNYIDMGDLAYLDAFEVSILAVLRLKVTTGTIAALCGNTASGNDGWAVRLLSGTTPAWSVSFRWGNGASWVNANSDTALTANTWYTIGVTFRQNRDTKFYLNGVLDGSATPSGTYSETASNFRINNDGFTANVGGSFELAHLFVYNVELWADEIANFHQRGAIPKSRFGTTWAPPLFWHQCLFDPGYNAISHASGGQEVGTKTGTVVVIDLDDWIHGWTWPDEDPQYIMGTGTVLPGIVKQGTMSTDMISEIEDRNRVFPSLKLTIGNPAVATKRYGSEALRSVSRGLFKPYITSWGTLTQGTDDDSLRLENSGINITIKDYDRDLTKAILQNKKNFTRNTTAEILLVSAFIDSGDEYVVLNGKVTDATYSALPDEGGILEWQLTIEQGLGLGLESVPKLPKVSDDLYGSAPPDNVSKVIPAIYGKHDSLGLNIDGQIEAIRGSRTNGYYAVTVGRPESVFRVTVDGAAQTETTDYTIVNAERAGWWITEIQFVTDPGDGVTVKCDVLGLTPFPDGSGAAMTHPLQILRHALNNFFFNGWKRQAYYDSSDRWNEQSISDTTEFLAKEGWDGSLVLRERTGFALLNTFSDSFHANVIWNEETKLTIEIDDATFADIYGEDDAMLHLKEHAFRGSLDESWPTDMLKGSIKADYLKSSAEGSFKGSITVTDEGSGSDDVKPIQIDLGPAADLEA